MIFSSFRKQRGFFGLTIKLMAFTAALVATVVCIQLVFLGYKIAFHSKELFRDALEGGTPKLVILALELPMTVEEKTRIAIDVSQSEQSSAVFGATFAMTRLLRESPEESQVEIVRRLQELEATSRFHLVREMSESALDRHETVP